MRHDDTEIFTGFLTWREKQVAEAIGRLETYEQVRVELGMRSVHTVRSHVKTVHAKLPRLYGIPAQTRVRMWAETSDGRANLRDVIEARESESAPFPAPQVATQAA